LFVFLEGAGYKTVDTDNADQALERILKRDIDILVSDLQMPGMDGVELLKRTKAAQPDTEVIVITGHATVDNGCRSA
jgi:DNA-binding NtrC family response regulator